LEYALVDGELRVVAVEIAATPVPQPAAWILTLYLSPIPEAPFGFENRGL